ncbi:hypothetical protein BJ170DRAFT_634205, partial [Xylariales sp. AK1849]
MRNRLSQMPRLRKPEWTEADEMMFSEVNDLYSYGAQDTKEDDPGTWYGLERIFDANASCEVAWLLKCRYRANYSFDAYTCASLSDVRVSTKRTIECREAAGSMDGEWVATWARIVVGVTHWAIHSTPIEYLRVISNCDNFATGGSYDVIDLLEDIGLVSEARIAEKRIRQYKEEWGLKFEN